MLRYDRRAGHCKENWIKFHIPCCNVWWSTHLSSSKARFLEFADSVCDLVKPSLGEGKMGVTFQDRRAAHPFHKTGWQLKNDQWRRAGCSTLSVNLGIIAYRRWSNAQTQYQFSHLPTTCTMSRKVNRQYYIYWFWLSRSVLYTLVYVILGILVQ